MLNPQDNQQSPDNLDSDPIITDQPDSSIITTPDNGRDPLGIGVDKGKGRDALGMFVEGHPDFVSQSGVTPGRKPTMKTQVREALQIAEEAMPQVIRKLLSNAMAGDVQSAVYLADRIYGRPKQAIDMDMGDKLTELLEGLSANREA